MKCTKFYAQTFSKAVLSLCLVLVFSLSCHPAMAFREEIAVLATGGAILRSAPSHDAAPVATYYAGVGVQTMEAQGDWFRIRVIKSPIEVSGYVHAASLIFHDARGQYEMGIRVATVLTDESGYVTVREGPEDNATAQGNYPSGMRVSVFGEVGNYSHICSGDYTGFVPKAALKYTEDVHSNDTGIPAKGFGVLVLPDGGEVPLTPYPGQGGAICTIPGDRSTVELFSQAGEWYQARWKNNLRHGFLTSLHVRAYWLSDLLLEGGASYTQGVYTVGRDLPSGLYTFTVPEGEVGSLQVDLPNASGKLYEAIGYATYTVYLPADALLTIAAVGTLAPMVPAADVTEAAEIRYTGSFKVLAGVQIPGMPTGLVTVSMAPGSTSSYFVVSDFLTEEGMACELIRKQMAPFTEYSIDLMPGQFLEVVNGTLCYLKPNG